MIGIIDYGLGNINAIKNIYHKLNISSIFISEVSQFQQVTKLILPGVGSFDWAIECLNNSGLRKELEESVLVKKIPILGICVGMQIMAIKSDEGYKKGLGWVDGEIKKFDVNKYAGLKVPHMGWNNIKPKSNHSLYSNIDSYKGFYFLHSYYFFSLHDSIVTAEANHGSVFSASLNIDNIYAVQFHPEKSHDNGIQLFKNFSEV